MFSKFTLTNKEEVHSSVIVSLLQKSIRRGNVYDAMVSIGKLLDGNFVNWIIKRLLIIAMEDCETALHNLPRIMKLTNNIEKLVGKQIGKSLTNENVKNQVYASFHEIVSMLANGSHWRGLNHLSSVARSRLRKSPAQTVTSAANLFSSELLLWMEGKEESKDGPITLSSMIMNLITVITWGTIDMKDNKHARDKVWKAIMDAIKIKQPDLSIQNQVINWMDVLFCLQKMDIDKVNASLPLTCATWIVLVLFSNLHSENTTIFDQHVPWALFRDYTVKSVFPNQNAPVNTNVVHITESIDWTVPDYAFDKHTKPNKGRGIDHFMTTGSRVDEESEKIFNGIWDKESWAFYLETEQQKTAKSAKQMNSLVESWIKTLNIPISEKKKNEKKSVKRKQNDSEKQTEKTKKSRQESSSSSSSSSSPSSSSDDMEIKSSKSDKPLFSKKTKKPAAPRKAALYTHDFELDNNQIPQEWIINFDKDPMDLDNLTYCQMPCGWKCPTVLGTLKSDSLLVNKFPSPHVFVKGPESLNHVGVQHWCNEIRREINSRVESKHQLMNVQYSSIAKYNNEYYLVCEDVTKPVQVQPSIENKVWNRTQQTINIRNQEIKDNEDFTSNVATMMSTVFPKHLLKDINSVMNDQVYSKVALKYCQILLFRQWVGLTDTNPRNVLVVKTPDQDMKLYSIDETRLGRSIPGPHNDANAVPCSTAYHIPNHLKPIFIGWMTVTFREELIASITSWMNSIRGLNLPLINELEKRVPHIIHMIENQLVQF